MKRSAYLLVVPALFLGACSGSDSATQVGSKVVVGSAITTKDGLPASNPGLDDESQIAGPAALDGFSKNGRASGDSIEELIERNGRAQSTETDSKDTTTTSRRVGSSATTSTTRPRTTTPTTTKAVSTSTTRRTTTVPVTTARPTTTAKRVTSTSPVTTPRPNTIPVPTTAKPVTTIAPQDGKPEINKITAYLRPNFVGSGYLVSYITYMSCTSGAQVEIRATLFRTSPVAGTGQGTVKTCVNSNITWNGTFANVSYANSYQLEIYARNSSNGLFDSEKNAVVNLGAPKAPIATTTTFANPNGGPR